MNSVRQLKYGLEQAANFAHMMGTGITSVKPVVAVDSQSARPFAGHVSTFANGLFYVSREKPFLSQKGKSIEDDPALQGFSLDYRDGNLNLQRTLPYPDIEIEGYRFVRRNQTITFDYNRRRVIVGDYFRDDRTGPSSRTYGIECEISRISDIMNPSLELTCTAKLPDQRPIKRRAFNYEDQVDLQRAFHNFMSGEGVPIVTKQ